MNRKQLQTSVPTIRCAIYTRKSSEEGLELDFNSLDAQREAGEAYIASQRNEGWVCLPERYDDGGYTGGNMERPAVQRLLADVQANKIDCVVVYKVDRLSRSLLDFARIVEILEKNRVSFVSVTQQFNTTHSMGRLMLNILLSFAQFEREIASERTRDKIAAARRKGKWSGGKPLLGYDLVSGPGGSKLIVNEDEAFRVGAIYRLYLERQSLVQTVKELDARDWRTKQWTTKKGRTSGGKQFDKNKLFATLSNPTYLGKVKYKDELHEGEHAAILPVELWQKVQSLMQRNGRSGGTEVRNKYNALLKGLLYCKPCGCVMGHSYTSKGEKRYRYYVCMQAQKRGWHTCPSRAVPAGEIERFVVEQIRSIGRDPQLLGVTLQQARKQVEEDTASRQTERGIVERELKHHCADLRKLAAEGPGEVVAGRLADLQTRIQTAEQRIAEIDRENHALGLKLVDEHEVRSALIGFDPVWDSLSPKEQARVIHLLVERIDYDGRDGTLSMTFLPTGIKTLAQSDKEAAA